MAQPVDRTFADLLEAAPDAMVCVDSQGRIAAVNAQAEKLFDYPRGDLVGQPVEALVPDAIQRAHARHRDGYQAQPRSRPMGAGMDLAGRRRDGSTFPAEISLSTIHAGEGILVVAAVRDLTERRHTAETASRLAAIVQSSPVAIIGKSIDEIITSWNPAAERLYGYRASEMIGQHIGVLIPAEDRQQELEILTSVARGIRIEAHRAQRVRKDGSLITVSLTLTPITDSTGKITGTSTVARALTSERDDPRFAEAAARLASIIQCSHDAVVGKTLDGIITSWNPAAERLFGYTANEVIGRHYHLLIPQENRDEETGFHARVTRDGQVHSYEARRRRKDGSIVTASIVLSPIVDGNGTITGMSAIVRDLTERQRADARFVALLEAAPDAMICVAADGRMALVNAQAERLFGYRREELVGQPVEILVPEAVRAQHPGHRARYAIDPKARPMGVGMDLAARRRDGSTFPAEISLSAIHTDEGMLVTAAVRDITERLEIQAERERLTAQAERDRMERQMHQSRRLESLGQLAGGVAHDFNNLLGVISGYTAILHEEVASAEPADRWQPVLANIGQVQQAARHAAGLTRQLLAFARQEVIKPRPLNLNDIVTSVQQLLIRTLGEHIELITDLDPQLRAVMADPGQIEQVLVNLAVNARDAMPAGGHLTIETINLSITGQLVPGPEVPARAASRPPEPQVPARGSDSPEPPGALPAGPYVVLKVSDTGTGIPKEIIDRVFEPFFTTKPEGHGTGLGLATVYGVITQAGGHLRINSEPGLGTTLTAILPATDQAADTADRPAEPARGSGETILLVEDADALREAARQILTRNGYQVLTAANGPEALEILGNHQGPVHVLLTDVVMPQMQGKQLADKVRADRPGIRVLFMSGYTQGLLGAQGVLDHGVHLIEKPFDQPALLARLNEVLRAST